MKKYPEIVEIQFHNFCNAYCSICPYESYASQNTKRKMPERLKQVVLEDLREHRDQVKRVIPYYNNEPFLDADFLVLLRWFKIHMPETQVEVSTNLSAYSDPVFRAILEENLIDDLRISFFGGTPSTYHKLMPGLKFEVSKKKLKSFLDLYDATKSSTKYALVMILHPEYDIPYEAQCLQQNFPEHDLKIRYFGYLDRAGSNAYRNKTLIQETPVRRLSGCSLKRNEERLCIDVNGRVPLCSQDWFSSTILGDLEKQTITDIWNGEQKAIVDRIISGKSPAPDDFICKKCKLVYYHSETKGKAMNFEGDRYMTSQDTKRVTPS